MHTADAESVPIFARKDRLADRWPSLWVERKGEVRENGEPASEVFLDALRSLVHADGLENSWNR
jgi:hypothetical protein